MSSTIDSFHRRGGGFVRSAAGYLFLDDNTEIVAAILLRDLAATENGHESGENRDLKKEVIIDLRSFTSHRSVFVIV
jgi:hypothetical protein